MGNKTENEFEKGYRIEFGISNEGKNYPKHIICYLVKMCYICNRILGS